MALSMTELRRLTDAAGLKYFVDPNQNLLLVHVGGIFGSYQVILFNDLDGRFLQFRSLNLLSCSPSHPHLAAVLELLATLNFLKRYVKFGWSEENGEIVAYGDAWIMDGTLTDQQFQHMLHLYLQILDFGFARVQACLETGGDPGEPDPKKSGSLSDKLRKALKKKPPAGGKDDAGPVVESL